MLLHIVTTINYSRGNLSVVSVPQTGRARDEPLAIWQAGHVPVKWHLVVDVPGTLLEHILLTNNDRKPVTVSRDTQEVRWGRTSEGWASFMHLWSAFVACHLIRTCNDSSCPEDKLFESKIAIVAALLCKYP